MARVPKNEIRRGRKAPPGVSALIQKKRFVMPPAKRVWSLHSMGFDMPSGFGGIKPISFQDKCDLSVIKHNASSVLARCVKQIETMKDNKVFLLRLSEVFSFRLLNNSLRMIESALEECKWHMQTLGGICKNNGIKLIAIFDVVPKKCMVDTTMWFMFIRKLWRIIAQDGKYFTWFRIAMPMTFLAHNLSKFSSKDGLLDLLGILDTQTMVPYFDKAFSPEYLQTHVNICVSAGVPVYFDVRSIPDASKWIPDHESQLMRINAVFIMRAAVSKLTKRTIRDMFEKYRKLSRYGAVMLIRKN